MGAPDPLGRVTGIFAKHPRPGAVKTRLSPPLDPAEAAELAEAMLADALRRAGLARALYQSVLCFAPAEERAWFEPRLPPGVALEPQAGAGLGERLGSFFARHLAAGRTTVVALGTDAPLIESTEVARAHELLEHGVDCVVGPDTGGGYWLIGLGRPAAALFEPEVMRAAPMVEATLARARSLGLECASIGTRRDVDRYSDLMALRIELEAARRRANPEFPRAVAAVVERLAAARRAGG